MDEVIHDYDEVKYVTLDVAGINQISFKLVKGSQDVGIGVPKLWKAGQTATVATNPMDKLPRDVSNSSSSICRATRGSYVKLHAKDREYSGTTPNPQHKHRLLIRWK